MAETNMAVHSLDILNSLFAVVMYWLFVPFFWTTPLRWTPWKRPGRKQPLDDIAFREPVHQKNDEDDDEEGASSFDAWCLSNAEGHVALTFHSGIDENLVERRSAFHVSSPDDFVENTSYNILDFGGDHQKSDFSDHDGLVNYSPNQCSKLSDEDNSRDICDPHSSFSMQLGLSNSTPNHSYDRGYAPVLHKGPENAQMLDYDTYENMDNWSMEEIAVGRCDSPKEEDTISCTSGHDNQSVISDVMVDALTDRILDRIVQILHAKNNQESQNADEPGVTCEHTSTQTDVMPIEYVNRGVQCEDTAKVIGVHQQTQWESMTQAFTDCAVQCGCDAVESNTQIVKTHCQGRSTENTLIVESQTGIDVSGTKLDIGCSSEILNKPKSLSANQDVSEITSYRNAVHVQASNSPLRDDAPDSPQLQPLDLSGNHNESDSTSEKEHRCNEACAIRNDTDDDNGDIEAHVTTEDRSQNELHETKGGTIAANTGLSQRNMLKAKRIKKNTIAPQANGNCGVMTPNTEINDHQDNCSNAEGNDNTKTHQLNSLNTMGVRLAAEGSSVRELDGTSQGFSAVYQTLCGLAEKNRRKEHSWGYGPIYASYDGRMDDDNAHYEPDASGWGYDDLDSQHDFDGSSLATEEPIQGLIIADNGFLHETFHYSRDHFRALHTIPGLPTWFRACSWTHSVNVFIQYDHHEEHLILAPTDTLEDATFHIYDVIRNEPDLYGANLEFLARVGSQHYRVPPRMTASDLQSMFSPRHIMQITVVLLQRVTNRVRIHNWA